MYKVEANDAHLVFFEASSFLEMYRKKPKRWQHEDFGDKY